MKRILIIIAVGLFAQLTACKKSDFADDYADPSKLANGVLERQYAGFLRASRAYVLPNYWNYFVILRTTINRYIQTTGYANTTGQYVPGASAVDSRWTDFYTLLAQYREIQLIQSKLPEAEQKEKRVFELTATIYLYDQLQKVVDLHGDAPFSTAGLMHANGGNYNKSAASFDSAENIYTKMLDDLKAFSDELNSLTLISSVQSEFKKQDFVNLGDVNNWKRYCNSLRLRMLTRVSGVAEFQSRATSEIAAILGDPAKYPVITSNTQNIQMDVYNLDTDINSKGFQTGLEDWDGNIASKKMIDIMQGNGDPRLRVVFQPGDSAAGVYTGLDPLLNEAQQTALINSRKMAIYNRYTLSRNQFFPGVLINAAEVSFIVAEAALKAGQDAIAKTAYEKGITESVEYYYNLHHLSNSTLPSSPAQPTPAEIAAYLSQPAISWSAATTPEQKIGLIATQKWLHFNVVQAYENWSEVRRLNAPTFNFWNDNANPQPLPPDRWNYSAIEKTYNSANYESVSAKDKLTTKLFWDVN